ncbi:MAG: hypothetical protein FWB73_03090 [Treponema sp.]|nr:hypothetical protein [Treponema sp.]
MNAEMTAVVITAILGPLLVLFLSELLKYLESEKQREERFFLDVFNKRMELYEEIIKATEFLTNNDETLNLKTAELAKKYYLLKQNILLELAVRCVIFGSENI